MENQSRDTKSSPQSPCSFSNPKHCSWIFSSRHVSRPFFASFCFPAFLSGISRETLFIDFGYSWFSTFRTSESVLPSRNVYLFPFNFLTAAFKKCLSVPNCEGKTHTQLAAWLVLRWRCDVSTSPKADIQCQNSVLSHSLHRWPSLNSTLDPDIPSTKAFSSSLSSPISTVSIQISPLHH